MKEELWVIKGTQPVCWTVPFYVHFKDDSEALAVAMYACPMLQIQKKWVDARLRQHAREEKGLWVVTRPALEQLGYQVQLCDPELLLTWERSRSQPITVDEAPPATSDREEFLNGLFLTGLFKNRGELDVIYYQFCLHTMDWLINREKPVDLYFARLHNCPFRTNWKHVIMSRFPRLGRILCHVTGPKGFVFANEGGLLDELKCPDLLAMDAGGLARRTIEIELTARWHKNVHVAEQRRFKQLGPINYAEYFMQSVARWSKMAVQCYVSWCNLVARPSAANVECGDNGEFRLVPNTPPKTMLRVNRRSYPVPAVVPNRMPDVIEASQPKDLYPKAGILPDEVSPVRPSSPDVRDRRPDLYQREHWKDGKLRLLVLNASEGANPL